MVQSIWLKTAGVLLSWLTLGSAGTAQEIPITPLAPLQKLDSRAITVSGISSGAFFAHQFHVAYSSLVKGVGMVAGGPYACADNEDSITPPNPFEVALVPRRVVASLAVCTHFGTEDFKRGRWRRSGTGSAPARRPQCIGAKGAWRRRQ